MTSVGKLVLEHIGHCIQGLVRLLRKTSGKKRLNAEQQFWTTAGKKGEATRDCGRVDPGLLEVVVQGFHISDHSARAQLERADASECERMRAEQDSCTILQVGVSLGCHFVAKNCVCERWVLPFCKKCTLGTPVSTYRMGLPTRRAQPEPHYILHITYYVLYIF
jgi:hypothetical protein